MPALLDTHSTQAHYTGYVGINDDERASEKKLFEAESPDEADDGFDAAETGIDPIQNLLNQRHPRIRLHRETLNLLQRAGAINARQGVHDFCNEAIRYVVLSGEAAMVTFADLHAVSAAMDARLDELNVILLRLHQSVADLSLMVEQGRIIGAYGERLKKLAEK